MLFVAEQFNMQPCKDDLKQEIAYHLNGIFGSFFWTNGLTALFSTKEAK